MRPEQLPAIGGTAPVRDPAFVAAGLRAGRRGGHRAHHSVGVVRRCVREPGDVADSLGTAEASCPSSPVRPTRRGGPRRNRARSSPWTAATAPSSPGRPAPGHRPLGGWNGTPTRTCSTRVLARGDRPTASSSCRTCPDAGARPDRPPGSGDRGRPAHDPVGPGHGRARRPVPAGPLDAGRAYPAGRPFHDTAVTLFGGAVSTSPRLGPVKAQCSPATYGDLGRRTGGGRRGRARRVRPSAWGRSAALPARRSALPGPTTRCTPDSRRAGDAHAGGTVTPTSTLSPGPSGGFAICDGPAREPADDVRRGRRRPAGTRQR